MNPRLETERLILRRWHANDRAPFAEMCADPAVMKYIGAGLAKSPDESAADIERFEMEWTRNGHGLFALELKATGRLAGFTGLSVPDFLPEVLPAVEIGWRLDRMLWGRGFATEAAQKVLDWGRSLPELPGIVSICHVDNVASQTVTQKIGLVFDRRTRTPARGTPVLVYRAP